MIAALQFVAIPGYREAVRRERLARDRAWLGGNQTVCGLEIVPLSLRRLIWLDHAHCGFVTPWKFESDDEAVGHAVLFLWMMRPGYRLPVSPRFSMVATFWRGLRQHRFGARLLRHNRAEELIAGVRDILDESFLDAPTGDDSRANQSFASYPAYIFDRLAAAGFNFTADEILDMPMARLWQFWRVAGERCGVKLTNPSDDMATRWLARQPGGHN